MQAWKFLDARGGSVFSGYRWPRPRWYRRRGPWVETTGALEPCRRGVHACRSADLAWWINAELWEVELDGPVVESEHKVVASRGRIVGRVRAWSGGVARELGEAAAWRARDLAVAVLTEHGRAEHADRLRACRSLKELEGLEPALIDALGELTVPGKAAGLATDAAHLALVGEPYQAPFAAACAAGHAVGSRAPTDRQTAERQGFIAERREQSRWIVTRLGLPA